MSEATPDPVATGGHRPRLGSTRDERMFAMGGDEMDNEARIERLEAELAEMREELSEIRKLAGRLLSRRDAGAAQAADEPQRTPGEARSHQTPAA